MYNLYRPLTNFKDIPPHKENATIRVVSYNITSDFFDYKDTTPDARHKWVTRKPFVEKMLYSVNPDIFCLQEVSPHQAGELTKTFTDYSSIFLSQTPSEIPVGEIAKGHEIETWQSKNIGKATLIGIFVKSSNLSCKESGRFWLKENPHEIPTELNTANKGFGSTEIDYRAVLWSKIEDNKGKVIYIFNSHYPLKCEDNNATRAKCAKLERAEIKKIAGENSWVATGDRNLVERDTTDTKECNPSTIYHTLIKDAHDVRDHDPSSHYGASTTFLGFSYDSFQNEITATRSVLDVMVSSNNLSPVLSAFHPGIFDIITGELPTLSSYNSNETTSLGNEGRYFASDHVMLVGDFELT